MTPMPGEGNALERRVRLAYVVSHPIQYQAPLLRRIAQEEEIDLTVFFGSDFSVRGYKDEGFGVEVAWDVPLLEGYKSEFLPKVRDNGTVSATTPISRGILKRLRNADGSPKFDAVWVHGYASVNALQTIFSANLLGIPVLLRAESWLGDRVRAGWKRWLKGALLHDLKHMIAATLPIGTKNAQYWAHYFGREFPQFLMPYAVDNRYFAARAEESATSMDVLRSELGLEAGRPVVLFASKLQTRKHCDQLIEAYAALTKMVSSKPYLVIVGDGEERKTLEAQVAELKLADVRFAGFQNQSKLPAYFRMADVFVLPSQHEPWGLIVNEAMAAGCAVVASSDVGSVHDLITNGVEGFVYPVGDVPALTHALGRVLESSEIAAKMGDAARKRMTTWSFEEDIAALRAALAFTTRKIRA